MQRLLQPCHLHLTQQTGETVLNHVLSILTKNSSKERHGRMNRYSKCERERVCGVCADEALCLQLQNIAEKDNNLMPIMQHRSALSFLNESVFLNKRVE